MADQIRVVISKESYGWVAQCVDYDIVAQGPTIKETKKRFGLVVAVQIILDIKNGREPLKWLGSPPISQEIYFENGERLESQKIPINQEGPGFPKEITADTRLHAYA